MNHFSRREQTVTPKPHLMLVTTLALAAACAKSSSSNPGATPAPAANRATGAPPNGDPRVGLKAGWFDAGEAIWNLRLVSTTRPSKDFINQTTPGDRRLS